MNRDRFIRQRRDDWQQLESVLARLRDLRAGRWLGTDIEMLARLYRSVWFVICRWCSPANGAVVSKSI